MKTWRVYAFKNMKLDEVPIPEPAPGWVLLKTLVVQPSITEVSLFFGLKTISYDKINQRLAAEAPVSLFGHEFCGEVVSLAGNIRNLKPGQRVVARGEGSCHRCPICRGGKEQLCQKRNVLGWTCPGAFAEFVTVPADMIAPIPDAISSSEGACIQPLSDAAAAMQSARIQEGDCVVILGQGVMGLMCLQVAKCLGAARIITIDVNSDALALSSELGANDVIDATKQDTVETILQMTDGLGANVVVDCAGGNPEVGLGGTATIQQSIDMARQESKILAIALYSRLISMDSWLLRDKSLQLIFPPSSSQETLERCIEWVASGTVKLKPLITHVLKGIGRVPEAFEITANKRRYHAISPAQVVFNTI
jgi:threonine dehydrogenase-like Zn-dependent dehydrogenase